MRILNILPYSPCPPHFGGALRIYHLLKEMMRTHEVTVVMYGTPQEENLVRTAFGGRLKAIHTVPKPLKLNGAHKRLAQISSLFGSKSSATEAFYSAAMQDMIDSVVSEDAFDLIQLENYPMGHFRVNCPGVPRIMDTQNVEHDSVRRMAHSSYSPIRRAFYAHEHRKVHREETEVYKGHDAILVTSLRDKALMDSDFPHVPKHIIPNGVDTSYFTPSKVSPEPHALVFTGAMNYFPNSDGMMYFLKKVFPLVQKHVADVRVYVVGGAPLKQLTSLASDNVVITGTVEDVRPYVNRASVYVVPLRMGGGTRLKVLEAMAMEKPVVTTSVGCEGLNVVDRQTVLIADNAEQFAACVIELLRDANLSKRLVANGRQVVHREYEWSVIGEKLNHAYESILGARACDPARIEHQAQPTLVRP